MSSNTPAKKGRHIGNMPTPTLFQSHLNSVIPCGHPSQITSVVISRGYLTQSSFQNPPCFDPAHAYRT